MKVKPKRERKKMKMLQKRLIIKPCEKCGSKKHTWPSLNCIRGKKELYSDPDYKAGTLRDMILENKK